MRVKNGPMISLIVTAAKIIVPTNEETSAGMRASPSKITTRPSATPAWGMNPYGMLRLMRAEHPDSTAPTMAPSPFPNPLAST